MKQVFSALILLSCHLASAQNIEWSVYELDSLTNRLEFNTELDLGGEDIQNHIFFKSVNGGTLDREILNEISTNIGNSSTFGAYNDSRIRFIAAPGRVNLKNNNSLFLEFGNVIYADAELQKDLFHLTFLGNADKLGETLKLGRSGFNSMIYQYAGLGVMSEKTRSYASLNLVNAQSYFGAELRNTTLYTGELAETLTLDYEGELTLSDSLSGNFISNSGLGFSLNGRWNISLADDQDLFSVEVRNAGLAVLNKATKTTSADSTLTFSGLSVNDLITDADYINGISFSDSISFTESSARKVIQIPTYLSMRYLHKINKSDYMEFSGKKYVMNSHSLELGLDYLHQESALISYAIGLSYGGFNKSARLRLGANLDHKNWNLSVHSSHLVGLFLEKSKGFNLSFGIQRKLYTAS